VASETAENAAESAQDVARSPALRRFAQAGLVAYAAVHLLVAWLVLQMAYGDGPSAGGDRSADQAGAMQTVARSPGGPVLLWLLAVAMAGLAFWQGAEFLRHHRHLPAGSERWSALLQLVKTVGTAVFYGYLAYSAVSTALGSGKQRGKERRQVEGVLSWPGGQLLVIAVALVTAGIGVYLAQKGLRSTFLDEFDLSSVRKPLRAAAHRFSQAGFFLKGLALVLVGGVLTRAAVSFDPSRATGLDGALRAVLSEPYGRWVLTAVGLGLASFAVYCLARARHPVG
jgi:hypothetical protein